MHAFISLPKPLKRMHWKYRMMQWRIHRRFQKTVTLQTQQGAFKLPLDSNDAISRHLYSRREFELDWVDDALGFLRDRKLCPPRGEGTVLDIGANNGVISIGMLNRGDLDRAIAIEPDPGNFALLKENAAVNQLEDRLTCLNFAASDASSELEFELSEDNYGDHRVRITRPEPSARELFNESQRRVIKVPAETIDNLLAGLDAEAAASVSLVWIDVQGYEGYVFRGARDLLSRGIPVVSEIWPYGIERAGMSLDTYHGIVSEIWSTYWTKRRGKLVQRPIAELASHLTRLDRTTKHENVIFVA